MGVHVETGEIIKPIDLVTTPTELIETLGISRGQLRNAMYRDDFEWVQIRRTVIIDRESFMDWWAKRDPHGLDMWILKK